MKICKYYDFELSAIPRFFIVNKRFAFAQFFIVNTRFAIVQRSPQNFQIRNLTPDWESILNNYNCPKRQISKLGPKRFHSPWPKQNKNTLRRSKWKFWLKSMNQESNPLHEVKNLGVYASPSRRHMLNEEPFREMFESNWKGPEAFMELIHTEQTHSKGHL